MPACVSGTWERPPEVATNGRTGGGIAVEPKRTKLGNQLGALFCLAGFALVWVGWNGAASYDLSTRQFPYLISGGIAGLCLVNVGVGLFLVQSQRAERARLEENLAGLSRILETLIEVSVG